MFAQFENLSAVATLTLEDSGSIVKRMVQDMQLRVLPGIISPSYQITPVRSSKRSISIFLAPALRCDNNLSQTENIFRDTIDRHSLAT